MPIICQCQKDIKKTLYLKGYFINGGNGGISFFISTHVEYSLFLMCKWIISMFSDFFMPEFMPRFNLMDIQILQGRQMDYRIL